MMVEVGQDHRGASTPSPVAHTTAQTYCILSVSTGHFALVNASIEEAQRVYQADQQQSYTSNRVGPVH
jgi:hypothetical protein